MYQETGSIKMATQILGIVYRNIWTWRDADPEFKTALEKAKANFLGILEDEATRRAVYGVNKPVYQGGKLVGYVTEYSDSLLQTLLKGAAPEKYGSKVELTGAGGKDLIPDKVIHVHSNVPLSESEEEVQKTIDLPADMVQVISSTPLPEAEKVPIEVNQLTKEDLDLLGEL